MDGVTDVQRELFKEVRIHFKYLGHEAVVWEPWGDSSRFWIGFVEPHRSEEIDISPLHEAFVGYRGLILLGPSPALRGAGER